MGLFGIGPVELLLILVVALLVFGPERLPEIAAGIGRAVRQFQQMSAEMTAEVKPFMDELQGIQQSVADVQQSVAEASASATAELDQIKQAVAAATSLDEIKRALSATSTPVDRAKQAVASAATLEEMKQALARVEEEEAAARAAAEASTSPEAEPTSPDLWAPAEPATAVEPVEPRAVEVATAEASTAAETAAAGESPAALQTAPPAGDLAGETAVVAEASADDVAPAEPGVAAEEAASPAPAPGAGTTEVSQMEGVAGTEAEPAPMSSTVAPVLEKTGEVPESPNPGPDGHRTRSFESGGQEPAGSEGQPALVSTVETSREPLPATGLGRS